MKDDFSRQVGYSLQRRLWTRFFRNLPGRETQLWEPEDLFTSNYDVDTVVTDHLRVIEKSSKSILFRAGHSAGTFTDEPRENDSMVEVTVDPDFAAGYVDFGIKTAMYQGSTKAPTKEKPMQNIQRLHMWYTEVLLESALGRMKAETV